MAGGGQTQGASNEGDLGVGRYANGSPPTVQASGPAQPIPRCAAGVWGARDTWLVLWTPSIPLAAVVPGVAPATSRHGGGSGERMAYIGLHQTRGGPAQQRHTHTSLLVLSFPASVNTTGRAAPRSAGAASFPTMVEAMHSCLVDWPGVCDGVQFFTGISPPYAPRKNRDFFAYANVIPTTCFLDDRFRIFSLKREVPRRESRSESHSSEDA